MGRVRVSLKTGAILTVLERQSNKRKINSSESAAKRSRTTVEKHERSMAIIHTHHCTVGTLIMCPFNSVSKSNSKIN